MGDQYGYQQKRRHEKVDESYTGKKADRWKAFPDEYVTCVDGAGRTHHVLKCAHVDEEMGRCQTAGTIAVGLWEDAPWYCKAHWRQH